MSFRRVVGADAVSLVATLLRGEDDRWPIFLLGAGASFRSGVPTAADAVKQIAKIVYAERKLQGVRPPEERPWFENEGFGYAVVYMNGRWYIRIKPFYMFTGPDAKTPLPSFARTARATRRMKFDKNKNVETDLVFWATFLADGSSTMNLGIPNEYDILVDATYLSIEVPESR
jgi:hypothetical protein